MNKFVPNRPEFIEDEYKSNIILGKELSSKEWYELLKKGITQIPEKLSKNFYAYHFIDSVFNVKSLRGLDPTVTELVTDIFDSWIYKELGNKFIYSCSFSRNPVIGVNIMKADKIYAGPNHFIIFIYWTGKRWKLYIPMAGNWINIKTRKPFGLCGGNYGILDKKELERQGCKLPIEKALERYGPDVKLALNEFTTFTSHLGLLEYVYN